MSKSLIEAAAKIRDAFTYDPGHSDLDNEQPIHISVTLGDWRKLNMALLQPVDGVESKSMLKRQAAQREYVEREGQRGSWMPPSTNPDHDHFLWPIAVMKDGKPEMLFEYYHFIEGWATDDHIIAWWNQPVAPFRLAPYPIIERECEGERK